eukprot:SAG11_NODE_265_length_11509_cov_26.341455_7_plen_72_part_00
MRDFVTLFYRKIGIGYPDITDRGIKLGKLYAPIEEHFWSPILNFVVIPDIPFGTQGKSDQNLRKIKLKKHT